MTRLAVLLLLLAAPGCGSLVLSVRLGGDTTTNTACPCACGPVPTPGPAAPGTPEKEEKKP